MVIRHTAVHRYIHKQNTHTNRTKLNLKKKWKNKNCDDNNKVISCWCSLKKYP